MSAWSDLYRSDVDSDNEIIIEDENSSTRESELNYDSDTDSNSLYDNTYSAAVTEVDYIYYYDLMSQEIHDFTRMEYPEDDDLNDGYYIGFCSYESYSPYDSDSSDENTLLLRNFVSSKVFFRYPIDRIRNYLLNWSGVSPQTLSNCDIEIMKLKKVPTTSSSVYYYQVEKKTHLLKYIQRAWKNTLKNRNIIYKKRRIPVNLHYREIHGKWPEDLRITPTLKGCLYYYSSDLDREILYKY